MTRLHELIVDQSGDPEGDDADIAVCCQHSGSLIWLCKVNSVLKRKLDSVHV